MDLSVIDLKNNILKENLTNTIKSKIINRINELQLNLSALKLDVEFLLMICSMIEHLVQRIDKINKKDLLNSILKELLPELTEEELLYINKNVEFLHQNKKIKKVSYYRLFKTCCGELFKKK